MSYSFAEYHHMLRCLIETKRERRPYNAPHGYGKELIGEFKKIVLENKSGEVFKNKTTLDEPTLSSKCKQLGFCDFRTQQLCLGKKVLDLISRLFCSMQKFQEEYAKDSIDKNLMIVFVTSLRSLISSELSVDVDKIDVTDLVSFTIRLEILHSDEARWDSENLLPTQIVQRKQGKNVNLRTLIS